MNNETTPRVYVGTYAKYNNGNLFGAWLDLTDYSDKDAFIEAALELHEDEADSELMFQDFEGFPRSLYGECSISEDVWSMIETEGEWGAKCAFVEAFGSWDTKGFENAYLGPYESMLDYAYEYTESTGMLDAMPDNLKVYFDYEKFAHDLSFDITDENGYFFSKNW